MRLSNTILVMCANSKKLNLLIGIFNCVPKYLLCILPIVYVVYLDFNTIGIGSTFIDFLGIQGLFYLYGGHMVYINGVTEVIDHKVSPPNETPC